MSKNATLWVCAACCKVGRTRMSVGDESCYMHAVECWADSFIIKQSGRLFAIPADNDWVPNQAELRTPEGIMTELNYVRRGIIR